MYDANKNNMWPQQHQRFMGPIPPHHPCLQSPSLSPAAPVPVPVPTTTSSTSSSSSSTASSSSSSSSSLHQLDAHVNQRMDNHIGQQHPHHHHHHHHHHGVVELPMPSNPRASRNMAEKQRRDNLNANISTMAALVPAVAGSSRRMDKISILRLAAAYLRSQYTLGPGPESFLPRHYDFDLEQYIIENLVANAGFFLVVTTLGKIVYVSRYIENHLGHAQHEMLGQSLYHFVCPDDCEELQRNLTPDGFQSSTSTNACGNANEDNSSSSDEPAPPKLDRNFTVQRRSFNIRMSQKAVNKREHGQYEYLQISGQLRLANACANQGTPGSGRATHREVSTTGNDIVFVGIARLVKKRTITELSLLETTKDEYVTRHLVDGRIIFCDHRISVVAGYMTEEVSGLSAFKFMHKEDVRWTIIALRQMYDRGEGFGSSCYRLLSKTGQFIYLRTHGYLEFDKDTQTVESFVCVNTLVSEKEGMKLVKEMKERFAAVSSGPAKAMIAPSTSNSLSTTSTQQVDPKATVEDPAQLEDVINHLISDLASPTVVDDRASPSPLPDNQYYKAKVYSHGLPPAMVQANKIGIKSINCRSPPGNRLLYNVKTENETGRRDSVLSNEDLTKIERLRENNNDAVAGPSFTEDYDKTEIGIVEETRFPVKSENCPVAMPGTGHSIVRENSTTTAEGIDINVDICRDSLSPGNAVPSIFKSSNNNLQEKRTSRKRASQNSEKEKRYCKQQQQQQQQQPQPQPQPQHHLGNRTISTLPRKMDTRVSSTSEVVRNRERVSPSKVNNTLNKGNNIPALNETRSFFNVRKRSRSGDEFTGTNSTPSKRKAVQIPNNFVPNEEDPSDSDHSIYYANSDPVNIAGFIGASPLSSTDDLGNEVNRLNVDIGEQIEDDDIGDVGIDISIDDLAEGAGSCLESMDVYQQFNTSRLLDSSDSIQEEEGEEEEDEEEDGGDGEEEGKREEEGVGEEEMSDDLREGKLSPSLDADPDLMKTFEDLQTVMCNGKTIDEANVNQFTASDHAVSEGIRRSQFQLEKSIALRESQLNVLKRDLDNPAALKLQAQRENFTQLEAEHNKYKQMLKTLQQDHLTLQANTQHNVGV